MRPAVVVRLAAEAALLGECLALDRVGQRHHRVVGPERNSPPFIVHGPGLRSTGRGRGSRPRRPPASAPPRRGPAPRSTRSARSSPLPPHKRATRRACRCNAMRALGPGDVQRLGRARSLRAPEMVDAARPSARAIARSDRPAAFRSASRSLSSAERWAYPDMAAPFSVWRQTDTLSVNGVAPHAGIHPRPAGARSLASRQERPIRRQDTLGPEYATSGCCQSTQAPGSSSDAHLVNLPIKERPGHRGFRSLSRSCRPGAGRHGRPDRRRARRSPSFPPRKA